MTNMATQSAVFVKKRRSSKRRRRRRRRLDRHRMARLRLVMGCQCVSLIGDGNHINPFFIHSFPSAPY